MQSSAVKPGVTTEHGVWWPHKGSLDDLGDLVIAFVVQRTRFKYRFGSDF